MNRINLSLLIPSTFLTLIGLSVFYSIDIQIFRQQLIFLAISLLFYFIFIFFDYNIINYYSKQIYIFIITVLTALFIIGIEVKGAIRWIDLLGIRVQFSEIFKPFVIIMFAFFISKNDSNNLYKYLKILILALPIFFLILRQPDLGNAIVYLAVIILMMFVSGFSLIYFLFSGLLAILSFPIFFRFLHDYQKDRIFSFLNISHDPLGSSYNAIQAVISIGSGGIFGKGLNEATQSLLKFLPERHTDFIFATISESFGLVGSIIILILYFFLLYNILKLARKTVNRFSSLILYGFFFLLLLHFFINIGMNIGLMPIVGITLPFVSYGGSSLLTNFIILGIISAISSDNKTNIIVEIK